MEDLQTKAPEGSGASSKSYRQYAGQAPSNYKSSRKPPPYSKRWFAKLRQGEKPANCVWIACGAKSWKRVKHDLTRSDSWALCLPPREDPEDYRWPVRGLDVIVINTGGNTLQQVKRLCACCVRAGANKAIGLSLDPEIPPIYLYPLNSRRAA